jgi:tetratricopeptide (TPR) repeat protein
MKLFVLTLSLLSICFLGGCSGNPFDDMSSVPAANRVALKQCLAAPDLPDNKWPKNAGKARCWLSLPQSPSLRDVAAMLREPDGTLKLDRLYAEILEAHYKDPAHRDSLFRAYSDFGTPQGRLLATEWMAKAPGSEFARLAKGEAALGAAWEARGNAFSDKTSDAQFESMTEQLKLAVPSLLTALHDEPRLSPACVDLMNIGDMVGDAGLRAAAAQHCTKVDPFSLNVNSMLLEAADPRWGGSFDAIDRVIEQIRLREKDSPMLASLLAKGIGRRAYMPFNDDINLVPIVHELDRAALTAPDPFYIDRAGLAYEQAGNRPKALVYYSQALRFAPDEASFLIHRAQLRATMGDHTHALEDARRAAIQPDDCGCKDDANLALVFRDLFRIDDERAELLKAEKQPKNRLWALTTMCQTYIANGFDSEHGLPCTKQLAEEFPDDSEAMYLRALTLYIVHDPAAAEFDARFRKVADPSVPAYAGEINQLEQFTKRATDKP